MREREMEAQVKGPGREQHTKGKKGKKKKQKPYCEEVDLALCFRRGFKSWV